MLQISPASNSRRANTASRLLAAIAALPAGFGLVSAVSAATLYWDAGATNLAGNGNGASLGGSGTWNTTLKNWDAGAVPYVSWTNGFADKAVFGGAAGTKTVTVSTISAGTIDLTQSTYVFNSGTLTFSGGTIDATTTNSAVFNTLLAGTLTYKATSNTSTTATGGGIGSIAGNNTGLTSFELNSGAANNQLLVSHAGAFGAAGATFKLTKGIAGLSAANGTIYNAWNTEFAGGILRLRIAGSSTYAGNGTVTANTDFATIAGATLVYSGTIALGSNTLTLAPGSATGAITLSNAVSGTGNLTLANSGNAGADGLGTVTLSAANSYSGQTTISTNGTLVVASGGSINSSSGVVINNGRFRYDNTATALAAPVTLNAGTLTGTGAVTLGPVTVANNSSAIITNNNGVAGAGITVGNLAFNGAATLNLKLDSASTSTILAAGGLSTNAAGNVTINAATNTGLWSTGSVYNLISYTGGSIGGAGFGQFTLGALSGLTSRQSSLFSNTGSAITLTINGDNPYWNGATNGDWNTSQTGNWKLVTAGTDTSFLQGDEVHFTDSATGTTTINITENVSTTAVLFNNTTKDYTIGSAGGFGVTSAVSVTKTGTGTVTLGSNNTYTGSTAINNGTLRVQGGTAIGDTSVVTLADVVAATLDVQGSETIGGLSGGGSTGGNVNVATGQALTVGGSGSQTYAGVISGSGGLSLTGNTTQTLTGASTYTGSTGIGSGSRLNLGTGGTTGSISASSAITNNGTLAVNRSNSVTLGSLSGTGTLSLAGGGSTVLGTASTFGGIVSLANTAGTTLDLGNSSHTIGALTGGGTTGGTVALGSGNLTLTASSNQTYSGVFTGSGDIVINAGSPSSIVTFGGTDTGKSTAFTGNVRVQAGVLALGKTADIFGTNSSGVGTQTVLVSGGATAKLNYGNAAYNQNQNFVLNGTGSDGLGALQATGMNFGNAAIGGIVAATDSLVRVTRDNSDSGSRTLLVRNALAGSGNLTFNGGAGTKPGFVQLNASSGEVTLAGTTYGAFSGNLNLAGNITLISNASNALGNVKTVDVATGTALTFNSVAAQTIGGLQGAGTVNVNGATLTVGASDASAQFTGLLQNASGTGSLVKIGSGSQTLSGVNSFSGSTTVNAGALVIGSGGSIANTSGISVASDATFTNNSATGITKALTLSEGATINGSGAVTAAGVVYNADFINGFTSVSVGSSFSKGGEISFNLTNITDGNYALFTGTSIGGSFTSVRVNNTALTGSGGVFSGMVNSLNYTYTDSSNLLTISSIPEPASFATFAGLALLGCAGARRRRRNTF